MYPVEPEDREVWAARIAEVKSSSIDAKARVDIAVIDARQAGASWATIAKGLGISRQGAMDQYRWMPEIVAIEESRV